MELGSRQVGILRPLEGEPNGAQIVRWQFGLDSDRSRPARRFLRSRESGKFAGIMDRATNRSRGFGFVEMATDEGADAAIKRLNGREIKGRPIRVNEAQARGGGAGGGRGPTSARDR